MDWRDGKRAVQEVVRSTAIEEVLYNPYSLLAETDSQKKSNQKRICNAA
jgi:hypothetical protein